MVAAGAAPAPDAAIVGSLIGQLVGWLVGLGMLVVMLSFQLVFLTVRRLTLTYSMLPTTSIFFQFLSAAIVVMLSLLSSLLPLWLVLRSLQPSLLLLLPYLAVVAAAAACAKAIAGVFLNLANSYSYVIDLQQSRSISLHVRCDGLCWN